MLTLGLRRFSRWAVVGLTLVSAPAFAARVPQPRELEASLLRLELPKDTASGRLSNDRFPLYFPVDRHHGRWKAADNSLFLSVHGHGHSARRYQSVSLQLLFWHTADFEAGVGHTERVISTIGLPDEVRAATGEMLRAARAQLQTDRSTNPLWWYSEVREAREAAGIQVRIRFASHSFVIVQFTDADAPEARWPARDDVERVHPYTHRHFENIPSDVGVFQDAVMLELRCRPAGRDAFRCRYLLDDAGRDGDRPVDATFSGLFRRAADGEWTVTLEQPPIMPDGPAPALIWTPRRQ